MARRSTILIVDDDEDFRLIIRLFLEENGYHVVEADDGNGALLMACSSSFVDLVLLDLEMPGMDGFEACRRFRLHPVTAKTPILMVTGFNDAGSIDKAFSAGAEDFINKPINFSILRQRIRRIIDNSRALEIAASYEANHNRERNAILATVSHDLRSPMHAILGLADLLAEGELSNQQREYLRIMNRSGEQLLAMIDDILDLSKIESGFSLIEKVPFDPRELVSDIFALFEPQAAKMDLTIKLQIADNLPTLVLGDPRRLRQIFFNLLGNAIKFTPPGGSIIFSQTVEGKSHIRFAVKDSGIGIAQDRQEVIFKPFVQAQDDIEKKYGGCGLGLAICQKLVQNMGGLLNVISEPGAGSEFFFTIAMPAAIEQHANQNIKRATRQGKRTETADNSYLGALNILVADDSRESQLLLKFFLSDLCKSIEVVENGGDAVEAFKKKQFDIIFMDMHMSGMDGIEATARIRALEKKQGGREVPIIAFSANTDNESTKAFQKAGCTIKLVKPVKKKRLLDVVAHCMNDMNFITD